MAEQTEVVEGRYVVITGDSHAGVSKPSDYREYVDPAFREDFDRWSASYYDEALAAAFLGKQQGERYVFERGDGHDNRFTRLLNSMTRGGMGLSNEETYEFLNEKYFTQPPDVVEGTWDSASRQRVTEADGVVGEVIHPDGVLGCTAPFLSLLGLGSEASAEDLAREAAGRRAYNRWLADLCNDLPGRRAGIGMIGFHDVDAAVAEVREIHELGLFGGIVLRDPIGSGLPGLADPRYEPLWQVCEELRMPLNNHAGSSLPRDLMGYANEPMTFALLATVELAVMSSKRLIWHLIAGGALERHPGLRLVTTEQHLAWVEPLMRELDVVFDKVWWASPMYRQRCELLPSEIWARQCFASGFSNRFEAELFAPLKNAMNVMWGSDYPHPEGTYPHTRISLQQSFHDLPVDAVASMVGGNMLRAYDFDENAVRDAAAKFGPTVGDLASAPDPADISSWAGRSPSFIAA
jgi:predicted TIM-barrel fold metal-dependent hydrolase